MLKSLAHRLALAGERATDRLFRNRRARPDGITIDPYIGYSTPGHIVVRGRVLAHRHDPQARSDQSRLTNLRQMVSLFLTDEVAGVEVRNGPHATVSDEEGYFTLTLPRLETPGWQSVDVQLGDQEELLTCPVLVTRADAGFMVVSDIDDTVLKTGAYSLARNLWTSFTGNALTREVYEDAVDLLNTLSRDGRNPIFYVSSSPWNMHDFLNDIFARAGLVRGPKLLRDLGLSETKFITAGHGNHKGRSIDTLVAANPDLPVILMGDTGQKDAKIYFDAIQRHPGRVSAVVLRSPGAGLDALDLKDVARLEETGVPVFVGDTFEGIGENLLTLLDQSEPQTRRYA